jgi:hypothetical protein
MQITDYREQEDGRLTLIVQGIDRFDILTASQQVPYAVAKVRLLPDLESWDMLTMAASDNHSSDAIRKAAKDVAVREGELLRELEFHQTYFGTSQHLVEVSPLSNINGTTCVDFEKNTKELESVFAITGGKLTQQFDDNDVLLLELEVWVELDRMIRLLQQIQPNMQIPVPSQMLGLLPIDVDWPDDFQLHTCAERLETNASSVGTHSTSPFVRLSRRFPSYPSTRRASRLSYAVWIMLSTFMFDGKPMDLQKLLETTSVNKRLQMAVDKLKLVCGLLVQ